MRNHEKEKRTILVTDAGRGSAIAIIRSLGRRGHRVLAADADSNSLGFRSRYSSGAIVYPSPEESPQRFVEVIHAAIQKHAVDLVIPVTDLTMQPLAAVRGRFEGLTQLAMPANEAMGIVNDKARTMELAQRLGVPTPVTRVVETTEEAVLVASSLGWPVVLKPESSHQLREGSGIESFKVSYAANEDELRQQMAGLEGRCRVLLQRYCAGVGCGVELLMSRGRPLAAFQHKRLREVPVSGGASSYRESVPLTPELYEYAVRILRHLRWTGLAMVEFKVGADRAELMEINGRVWGSLPLAVTSGMDFPAYLTQLYLEGEQSLVPRLSGSYRMGVRCRDLQRDLVWIASVLAQKQRFPFFPMPSRRRALSAFLGIFNPIRKQDLLVWQDPLPGLYQLPRILPRLWAKAHKASLST